MKTKRKTPLARLGSSYVETKAARGTTAGKVLGLFAIGAALVGGYSFLKSYKLQLERERAQTEAAKDNMVNEGGPTGGVA